jgi:MoaA/NifB/PqqE/SkfB family radical SAM enzyme
MSGEIGTSMSDQGQIQTSQVNHLQGWNYDTKSRASMTFEDLLYSPQTTQLQMEVTTDCNLRCVYCFTITENHTRGINNFEHFLTFIDELKTRKIQYLTICGYGEITFVKNWDQYCKRILDLGIQLQITTNLARELSISEADTLSRCSHINVSCDTADSQLFKELRKGADLRTLLLNINRIRSRSLHSRVLPPHFTISTVILNKTVWGIKDLIDFWVSAGIRQFHFCNYCKHDDPAAKDVFPVSQMPFEDLVKLPDWIKECLQYINDSGACYDFDSGILDGVEEKIAEQRTKACNSDRMSESNYTSKQQPGQTRSCLFPWNYMYIHANGDIRPCCICQPIANLQNVGSFEEVVNSERMVALRKGLLSGDLEPCCSVCPSMAWISRDELEQNVRDYMSKDPQPTEYSRRRQEFFEFSYNPLLHQQEYDSLRMRYDKLAADFNDLAAKTSALQSEKESNASSRLPFLSRICRKAL